MSEAFGSRFKRPLACSMPSARYSAGRNLTLARAATKPRDARPAGQLTAGQVEVGALGRGKLEGERGAPFSVKKAPVARRRRRRPDRTRVILY